MPARPLPLVFKAFLALVGLGAASSVSSCKPKTEETRVGAYLSLSGADSTFGSDTREGIDLAVEQVNAAGGVNGKRVTVLYEDDKSSAQEASNKVRELIDRDGVVALLGEVASSRSMSGGLIANTKHVPMVTPSSTANEVTRDRAYVFRTCFTNTQQGDAAARYAHDEMKTHSAAILYVTQDNYSSGLAHTFRDSFTRLGGTIAIEKGYQKGETNFTTYLSEVKAANPDVVFVPVYYADMVQIARQGKAVGLGGSLFVGGDAWDSTDLLEGAGAELEGAHFVDHFAPDVPWPNAQAFLGAFRAKFGHDPGSLTAQGYDAARLLFDAMARARSNGANAIKDALAATHDFAGATGTLTIDAGHDAIKPAVIVVIHEKKFAYASQIQTAALPVAADSCDSMRVWDAIVTGLAQGSMIALVALGYTMVYGVLRLINFAHGEVFMMAAYAGLFAMGALAGSAPPVVVGIVGTALAMVAASALGLLLERVAYRPLRGRGRGSLQRVAPLVTAIGCSVFLQNLAQLLFTARFRPYPHLFEHTRPIIFVTALAVMVGLELIVKRTWFGKALRALSGNEEAARLMGIRTSRVIGTTFALGSSLAAIGAVLYCLDQSQVYPTMGFVIGTRAFVAAVLGGIGSIPGALLGGLLLGILGELVKLTDYSGGVDVLVFVVLIAVLLVRPAGLLGTVRVEKV